MKLLVIDTETTGTDKIDSVCEIAATFYQIGENERTTGAIASISTLMPVTYNDAESINQIPFELTLASSTLLDRSLMLMKELSEITDYAIAFNAEFDAPLVNQILGEQKWLCAMRDINWEYPSVNSYGGFKLIDLALWLGIGVSTVHRAGDDVRLLVECFNRKKEILPMMITDAIERSNSPFVELKALVNYNNRELAKQTGFSWDGNRKSWIKKIRECDVEAFTKTLEFQYEFQNN
ncbi:3'-5' exonuclease [Aerosakkonema sp. BLCC-F183]|uniref:3'-5' exonuclease n=1 Tax=Aerosakkonema sp. BLCC-F183 TaxID=3342834 RepID=UPI0035B8D67B